VSTQGDDLTPLERLLAQAIEQRENGETVDFATLCAARPELRPEVEAALARLEGLHRAHREVGPDAAVGDVLADRYRLEASIGAGAMGLVYGAVDERLGRPVAVKVLRRELVVGARMDQRLAREAKALARIRHPHVVTVHDSGQCADGRSFVVMERLRGCSIGQLLQSSDAAGVESTMQARLDHFRRMLGDSVVVGGSDVRLCVEWVRQAADGIEAAHAAGVVHRDIKPSNLFLDRSGKVVVVDFGIVSVGDAATVGGDGSPLGTPAYMAPEQIVLGTKADARSDVYGLAATLYHLLAGRPPFSGSIQQVLHAVQRQDPPRADVVRPGLPADLVAIVERGMAKEPGRRYPSAAALRDDLGAWLEHRPVTARRSSWLGAALRRGVRSPALRTAAAMLLVGAASVGIWQWIELRAAARRAEAATLWAQVPTSLANDLPQVRGTNALRQDPQLAQLLDALVAVAEPPTIALAVRAIHHADGGDFAAATNDVQAIVRGEPAPFARQVAARYAAGQAADDLAAGADAPEHGGPGDRALLVLTAMRTRGPRPAWVEAVLAADDGLRRQPLFADLQLLLWQRRAAHEADADADAALRQQEALDAAALRLEERRQRASAVTCHVRGNALLYLGRVTEARAVGAMAIQCAPGDFVAWLLAGSAALRCNDAAAAVAQLRRACELQPASRAANRMLCDALVGTESFQAAAAVLERLPLEDDAEAAADRQYQLGLVALTEYFVRQRSDADGDVGVEQHRAEILARADAHFRAARPAGSAPTSLPEALCATLRGEPFSRRDLLDLLAATPLDGHLLGQVVELLPTTLDAAETQAIVRLLRAQARALGGHER
jgi:tRNA A-37 threonylcarbamoyl transferase component Bud32